MSKIKKGIGDLMARSKQRTVPQVMLEMSLSIFTQANESGLASGTVLGHGKNFSVSVGFTSIAVVQELVEFLVDLK